MAAVSDSPRKALNLARAWLGTAATYSLQLTEHGCVARHSADVYTVHVRVRAYLSNPPVATGVHTPARAGVSCGRLQRLLSAALHSSSCACTCLIDPVA